MKLAEALQERADLNRKIEELKRRIGNCILVQEGENPPEDPARLLKELRSAIERLAFLMEAINRTNCMTSVQGMSLTELIAKKDARLIHVSALRDFAYTAGQAAHRARGSEIRMRSTLKASDLQRQADEAAKEVRLLDNLLQETNWNTRLIEPDEAELDIMEPERD